MPVEVLENKIQRIGKEYGSVIHVVRVGKPVPYAQKVDFSGVTQDTCA